MKEKEKKLKKVLGDTEFLKYNGKIKLKRLFKSIASLPVKGDN